MVRVFKLKVEQCTINLQREMEYSTEEEETRK